MNSVLATIAPAIDAFTSMYSPARKAVSAMTSSVRFPNVALSRPPTASPVLAATDSVAWLSNPASGTDRENRQHEKQRVSFGLHLRDYKHDRHDGEQPEHGFVADFPE